MVNIVYRGEFYQNQQENQGVKSKRGHEGTKHNVQNFICSQILTQLYVFEWGSGKIELISNKKGFIFPQTNSPILNFVPSFNIHTY